MPFIEDHEAKYTGGYGEVWKVKIHPAHHKYLMTQYAPQNENPSYAIKKLHHNDSKAFNAEVSNLKKFSAKDHLHLIKLLVTFEWREQYFLLFPWADGNLQDFWKLYPKISDLKRDYKLTLWFAKQCLGIAEGLKMIHTLDKPDIEGQDHDSAHQIHGRHGDLKPENILWFKEYRQNRDPNCLMGVLKISDFGLTRFHGTMSKSHINAERIAVTGTYRAPEYDVYKVVSQSYDIWTLGCVILEFVIWYLLGWEDVDKFSQNRAKEHDSEVKEDVFFNFVNMEDENGRTQTGARAKLSVANDFKRLYRHDGCSDFMLDLLEFIEKRLLRMGPGNRAECNDIVEKFIELHEQCSTNRQYCTKRLKKPPSRTSTDLSLLSPTPLDFTPEMDKQINKSLYLVYTSHVETNADLSHGQSPVANPDEANLQDPILFEGVHLEPDGIDTATKSQLSTSTNRTMMGPPHLLDNSITPSSSHSKPLPERFISNRRHQKISLELYKIFKISQMGIKSRSKRTKALLSHILLIHLHYSTHE